MLADRSTRIYAESVVITLLAPAIGWLVQRRDPFFLRNGFSWLAVPPVLVALRHGFSAGVTSALLLVTMIVATREPGQRGLSGLPTELFYGVVLLTMLVGQVAASMSRKLDKVETDQGRLRSQLDGFSRSYMLLELSHERLEQRSVSALSSLRAALSAIFTATAAVDAEDERQRLAAISSKMLDVMASYGRVQGASVHLVDAAGTIEVEPLASLGAVQPVPAEDPLVAAALETGDVAHVVSRAQEATKTRLVAVVPLVDATATRVGVVAVHTLPFVALESSNLRLLHVIGGYAVDAMSASGGADAARRDQWGQFVLRLERAIVEARDERAPAALIAFWCEKAQRGTEALETLIAKDLRSTDTPILRRDKGENPVVLVVMPLTDADGTLAFLARLDRLARDRYAADLATLGISTRRWLLKGADAPAILAEVEEALKKDEGRGLAAPPV